jgi:hypothetical protein
MMAISIQQPWAYSILRLGKDVENRANRRGQEAARKQFAHTGQLLIHTSQRLSGDYIGALREIERITGSRVLDDMGGSDPATHLGAIVGLVTIRSVHTSDDCHGECSPWATPNSAHLMLEDPQVLAHPIDYPGRLGLWSVEDELVLAQIRRELA